MFRQFGTQGINKASHTRLIFSQRLLGKAVVPYSAPDSMIFPVSGGRHWCAMTGIVEGISVIEGAFSKSSTLRTMKIFHRVTVAKG
jgi:hypothetical protein